MLTCSVLQSGWNRCDIAVPTLMINILALESFSDKDYPISSILQPDFCLGCPLARSVTYLFKLEWYAHHWHAMIHCLEHRVVAAVGHQYACVGMAQHILQNHAKNKACVSNMCNKQAALVRELQWGSTCCTHVLKRPNTSCRNIAQTAQILIHSMFCVPAASYSA
jgi:hypothetical protein